MMRLDPKTSDVRQSEPPSEKAAAKPDARHGGGQTGALRTELTRKQAEIDALRQQLALTQSLLSKSQLLLIQKEAELNKITASLGWRLLKRYGRFKYHVLLPALKHLKSIFTRQRDESESYEMWAKRCEQFRYNREKARQRISRFHYKPTVSIVMPVYNTPREYLTKAIDSVVGQYYPHWELCLCDDGSTARQVSEVLEAYSASDNRIKVAFAETNQGIAAASNRALGLATGEFIGLLDHDDELTPDALFEIVATLQEVDADLIYSDEDKIDTAGHRSEPFFKPAWSPDLLLSCNYISHFGVYRREIVERIGDFRAGLDGSQDYDLALRFTEATKRIAHIPKILYHWRKIPTSAAESAEAKPYAYEAAKMALANALDRRNIEGEVEGGPSRGYYRVRRRINDERKVSIIIPTRDRLNLLRRCIHSIESNTAYRNYEIIIIDNDSRQPATMKYLSQSPYRVITDPGPFNFSRLNNRAARDASGDYLLLLNNDTEVISSEWLSAMVEHIERPEVGAVGAKLLYPKGRIQHAGDILGIGGLAGHAQQFVEGFTGHGYYNFPNIIRNYSAVTAACLMIRRELFDEIEGLNEELPVAFNDVDLCLRLRQLGYLIVYTPYALLYHHESASRGNDVNSAESSYMRAHWHHELLDDPYYNPNLNMAKADFETDYSKPEAMSLVYTQEMADAVVARAREGVAVGQEFFVAEGDLCAIAIRCSVSGGSKKGKVKLRLRESRTSESDIAVVEGKASDIREGQYNLFAFDPVRGANNRTFYFCVEFSAHSPGGALEMLGSSTTSDAIGPHLENHDPAQGTLSFRVYCHRQYRCANSLPARQTA
ncbi:MAG TPA: glycosyltransferase family 2 protein [Blastocatellia bacterium]|nr:glycosyltransferase family 2 protein [Blastocatellia bacterium]